MDYLGIIILLFRFISPPVGDVCTGRKVEFGPPRPGVTEKTKQFPKSFPKEKAGQGEAIWEGDLNMSLFHLFRTRDFEYPLEISIPPGNSCVWALRVPGALRGM